MTTRNPAPSLTNARGISGKLFSKQIGVPKAGSPPVLSVWICSPGARSTGICCSASSQESSSRKGTYSP